MKSNERKYNKIINDSMVKVLEKNSTSFNDRKTISFPKYTNNNNIPHFVSSVNCVKKYGKMSNDAPSTSGAHQTPVPLLVVPTNSRTSSTSSKNVTQPTQVTSSTAQTNVHPSIHMAPPQPRLALHHLHPLGPIAIQASPNPWPIVEPVFHFGPGFEHQNYCPTHSQGPQPHEYVVFFHVNAGVSVSFQIAGNREVIRGKQNAFFIHFK